MTSIEEHISSASVLCSNVDQPIKVSRVSPLLVQELVENYLGEASGVLDRDLVVANHALSKLLR